MASGLTGPQDTTRIARAAVIAATLVPGAAGLLLLALAAYEAIRPGGSHTISILSLAGAAALFAAVRRGGTVRAVAAVSCATLFLAAYASELVLESAPRDYDVVIARRLHRAYDGRTRRQVLDSLRSTGVDAWPSMVPAAAWGVLPGIAHPVVWPDSYPPLGGVPQVVTVSCNEAGQYLIYHSDALGFNNAGAPDSASPGGVAVLGDSFVHGECVSPDSNLIAALRRRIPDARGYGLGNNGPLLELATLREIVAPLRPRTVVWVYYEGNDLIELATENRNARLAAYLDRDWRLGLAGRDQGRIRRYIDLTGSRAPAPPPSRPEPFLKRLARLDLVRDLLRGGRQSKVSALGEAELRFWPDDAELRLLERLLETARAEVSDWGGRMVFAYLPAWGRFHEPSTIARTRRADVLRVAHEAGLTVVDMVPVFEHAPDWGGLFGRGAWRQAHYGPAGYALVASAIADVVESRAEPGGGSRP